MGNIIDIRGRLKSVNNENYKGKQEDTQVLDLTEKRSEALKADRRRVKRTLLTEFISVHTVVPNAGLMKVALYDITENGVAFDVEEKHGSFQVGEEVAMRVYLNHQTYFTFIVKVKYINEVSEESVRRHGAEFVKGTINDVALHHFIKFLENVSASLKHDKGDVLVSNIDS